MTKKDILLEIGWLLVLSSLMLYITMTLGLDSKPEIIFQVCALVAIFGIATQLLAFHDPE